MIEGQPITLKSQAVNIAIGTLGLVDGLLLTQPRQVLESFNRRDFDTGSLLGMRETITRGTVATLVLAGLPVGVGLLTYAVTRRADIAVAAAGAVYVAEGAIMDFSEAMSFAQDPDRYWQLPSERWASSLQRRLAASIHSRDLAM